MRRWLGMPLRALVALCMTFFGSLVILVCAMLCPDDGTSVGADIADLWRDWVWRFDREPETWGGE